MEIVNDGQKKMVKFNQNGNIFVLGKTLIVNKIFCHFTPEELQVLGQVSKSWYQMAKQALKLQQSLSLLIKRKFDTLKETKNIETEFHEEETFYSTTGRPMRHKKTGRSTNIGTDQLPIIFERVLQILNQSESNIVEYDEYYIQSMIIEKSFEFSRGSNEQLIKYVIDEIKQRTPDTNNALKKYREFMALRKEMKENVDSAPNSLSSIVSERSKKPKFKDVQLPTDVRHKWTPQDLERFKFAYERSGSDAQSNRRIANFIGNGVSVHHVAYLKNQIKKTEKRKRSKSQTSSIIKAN